jgi:hypothetical protein
VTTPGDSVPAEQAIFWGIIDDAIRTFVFSCGFNILHLLREPTGAVFITHATSNVYGLAPAYIEPPRTYGVRLSVGF